MSNYEIGYMKPPKETQFKPGQSGNKSGRPCGTKNTYKLLEDILNEKVQISQDGRQLKINKKTAILLQAVNSAVKGNHKSIQTIFPHLLAGDTRNEEREKVTAALKQDDQKIIKQFIKDGGHE